MFSLAPGANFPLEKLWARGTLAPAMGRKDDLGRLQVTLPFHEGTAFNPQLLERLQHTVRVRVLQHIHRQGFLGPHEAEDMLAWDHGGGFRLDATVRIEATDRTGLERLIRYRAQPPFALEFLDRLAKILPPPLSYPTPPPSPTSLGALTGASGPDIAFPSILS